MDALIDSCVKRKLQQGSIRTGHDQVDYGEGREEQFRNCKCCVFIYGTRVKLTEKNILTMNVLFRQNYIQLVTSEIKLSKFLFWVPFIVLMF